MARCSAIAIAGKLVVNGTTIATFLKVFLIQNTRNRDAKAVQIKPSELILALEAACNRIAANKGVASVRELSGRSDVVCP